MIKKTGIVFSIFFIGCLFISCSYMQNDLTVSAQKAEETNPEKALKLYDKAFSESKSLSEKKRIALMMESLVKNKIKRADLLVGILNELILLETDQFARNRILLDLAKLNLQNLKNSEMALFHLSRIDINELKALDREQYFQLYVLSYIKDSKDEQALIEADTFLNRKDLTPSEKFKLLVLRSKSLVSLKRNAEALKSYEELVFKYPNLSKKWKIRSHLAIIYEEQREYQKAIAQLDFIKKSDSEESSLVDWKIKKLKERLSKQPGQSGSLRR